MSTPPLSSTTQRNVELIAQVEQQLHERRSSVERAGERVSRFFGSLTFIGAHVIFITAWILLNTEFRAAKPSFDPYPFPLLGVVVGIEFIFLTTFVLMNQNAQSRRQEHWGHLNLQICLLAEQEITKNMQILHSISKHLGIETTVEDQEVHGMKQATEITTLVKEIETARELREDSE